MRALLHPDGEPSADRHPEGERLLGPDHPFAEADRELRQALGGLALTALFVAVAAVAGYPGRSALIAFPGAVVLVALVLRVGILADLRRQRALDLVLAGAETLPIPAVARLRRSLLGARRELASDRLRQLVEDARSRRRDPAAPPTPIEQVGDEATEVAALLRGTHSARAVAMTIRLLDGGAGWYALTRDGDGLRRELGRIRYLLVVDAPAPDEPVPAGPSGR